MPLVVIAHDIGYARTDIQVWICLNTDQSIRSLDCFLRVGEPDREDVRFSKLTSRLLYDAGIVHDEPRYRKATVEPQVPAC